MLTGCVLVVGAAVIIAGVKFPPLVFVAVGGGYLLYKSLEDGLKSQGDKPHE